MSIAICPGSFDPITLGHMDIITRASRLFEKIIVGVMINPDKHVSFTLDERVDFIKKAAAGLSNVKIKQFGGLLVDFAASEGATVIIRGLRVTSDFEYEFQMSLANNRLNKKIETVFLPASGDNMFLSSSVVKQIARFGGDISGFVPQVINDEIKLRLNKRV